MWRRFRVNRAASVKDRRIPMQWFSCYDVPPSPKQALVVHNERVKLIASALNGGSIALIAAAFIGLTLHDEPTRSFTEIVWRQVFSIGAVLNGAFLHLMAHHVLGWLREVE